jgi:hypothetical protein
MNLHHAHPAASSGTHLPPVSEKSVGKAVIGLLDLRAVSTEILRRKPQAEARTKIVILRDIIVISQTL